MILCVLASGGIDLNVLYVRVDVKCVRIFDIFVIGWCIMSVIIVIRVDIKIVDGALFGSLKRLFDKEF